MMYVADVFNLYLQIPCMSVNQRGGLNLAFISRLRITTILPIATLAHSELLMTTWSRPILGLGKQFALMILC